MNARITELLVNPDLLELKDIELVEYQIAAAPYMQSLHALHLLGIQKFKPEGYNAALSKTAAYTTDKKILYNFLNPAEKELPVLDEAHIEEKKEQLLEKEIATKVDSSIFEQQLADNLVTLPVIMVNGERNRALSPGEENFMNEVAPKIDAEATKEAGRIVLKEAPVIPTAPKTVPVKEELINVAKTEQPQVADSTVSLYDMATFLPGVTFKAPTPASSKPEKEEKTPEIQPEPAPESEEQQEKQKIEIEEPQETEQPVEIPVEEPKTEDEVPVEEPAKVEKEDSASDWKPMNFSFNVPDALLANEKPKSEEIKPEIQPEKVEKAEVAPPTPVYVEKPEAEIPKEVLEVEELPVINMSFFSSDLPKLPGVPAATTSIPKNEKPVTKQEDSNVPSFINTWQSWLKINREEQKNPKVQKTQVIDKFIETNPKISQLKEESTFVVKEKGNDISHLMTETLARLYFEQKLYSKAIKAYEILQEKHPDKKAQFEEVITKIKEARSGNK